MLIRKDHWVQAAFLEYHRCIQESIMLHFILLRGIAIGSGEAFYTSLAKVLFLLEHIITEQRL